jgi:hypothetical protein
MFLGIAVAIEGDIGGDSERGSSVAALLTTCRAKARIYTAREVEFLRSIGGAITGPPLTDAQMDWLKALAERESIDFAAVNKAALAVLQALCKRWLGDGVLYGKEWVARNPTRADAKSGSFRINVQSGQWADFATGDKGGDPISLAAYLHCSGDQIEGALSLKRMLGI